ncbi:Rcs stress response system protein RcsF [Serratia sp. S1B]|nr:Rcs stress response system protein RcsF [Serratia sp. S1B]
MRVFPLGLLALMLTGCSSWHGSSSHNLIPQTSSTSDDTTASVSGSRTTAVVYSSVDQLAGKPFRELGTVSGESCQATVQDTPPNLATARQRMQSRASSMNANVVLLHDCQIITGVGNCYRQAICQGTALNVSSK